MLKGRGTGRRHRVLKWPVSPFTGRSHKLVIPPESPDKKVLLLSHLRSIVDRIVRMPKSDNLSFCIMSTPGACASQICIEVLHAVVPRTPEAVCVLAASNNLTASRTVDEAAMDFANLLQSVCNRWPKVIVVDFPPRLACDPNYQYHLRQAYCRVAARMEMEATVNSLPRPSAEAQRLQVKLKRNIKYKGHQNFYTVNMKNVLAGLTKLKETHPEYSNVTIYEDGTFESL
ncbi:uncharacterized protein LOC133997958 [Scomber scombrus]|uniref:uncharacterized protein LOC133997958 n=1 Tax=Scomber scombrus TaxID=13677 RepID=UPI002DDC57A7|nr:uncharacterized protein LOC133997958 [Scomber scombrus]